MASVTNDAQKTFDDFKLGRAGCSFLLLRMVGDGKIDIVKKGPEEKPSWTDLCEAELKDDVPAWLIYHFSYQTTAGKRSKLVLLKWVPDECPMKQKMMYSMWTKNLKSSLTGIAFEIQACDRGDLDFDDVLARVSRFERDEVAA